MEIKSKVASNHNYYSIVVEIETVHEVKDLARVLKLKKKLVPISDNIDTIVYHTEIVVEESFSYTEGFLLENRADKSGTYVYRYDLYIGKLNIKTKSLFFITFPYKEIGRYIDENFLFEKFSRQFYITNVNTVLDFMKAKEEKELSYLEKLGFDVSITKYSAEIKESQNAKKVSLTGENPLKSEVYLLVSNHIKVEPILLKIRCENNNIGKLELSFDSYGNYRFWIRKNCQQEAVSALPYLIRFFNEIKALNRSNFLTKKSLSDD